MDIDAVFFDLYGTLLIYGDMAAAWSAWLATLRDRLNGLGVTIESARLAACCEGFFSRPEPVTEDPQLTVYERRLRQLCREIGLATRPAELRMLADDTAAAWQRHVTVDPDAAPVLTELKRRLAVALVSNYDHPPQVRRVLDQAGLLHLFDAVVISAEVGVRKPDPAIFASPLATLSLDRGRVAYVGDAPEDMAAASAAGMIPVLLRRASGATWAAAADFRSSQPAVRRPGGVDAASITIASLRELISVARSWGALDDPARPTIGAG